MTPTYPYYLMFIRPFYNRVQPQVLLACLLFIPTVVLSQATVDQVYYTALDENTCCIDLNYEYNGVIGAIDVLETRVLNNGTYFSAVQYPINNGWTYEEVQLQKRLLWRYEDALIPNGEHLLATFCFDNWNNSAPTELLVVWRENNAVRQRDTLFINCQSCGQSIEPVVECQADSSYVYSFRYQNLSDFSIDQLIIREPPSQDLIVEQNIALASSLAVGQQSDVLDIHFRPAAQGLEELCFEISARHFVNDTIAVDCCTASYCVPLPACDFCCTDYELFEADFLQGFTTSINCVNNTVSFQSNGLNECDQVSFSIQGLGTGVVNGQQSVGFANLQEDQSYVVCMQASRKNSMNQDCYEANELEICEEFVIDCLDCFEEDQIDITMECPQLADFVCACDSMSYVNDCAAMYWGGLTNWTTGLCPNEQLDSICLDFDTSIDSVTQLKWNTTSTQTLRYFIVQRAASDTPNQWIDIAYTDANTFSYTDPIPFDNMFEYRIIGVKENGKIILSVYCTICKTQPRNSVDGGLVWPNPTQGYLHIQLPLAATYPFEIYNGVGEKMMRGVTDKQGKALIDTQTWPSGLYYVYSVFGNKQFWRKAFVKSPL